MKLKTIKTFIKQQREKIENYKKDQIEKTYI